METNKQIKKEKKRMKPNKTSSMGWEISNAKFLFLYSKFCNQDLDLARMCDNFFLIISLDNVKWHINPDIVNIQEKRKHIQFLVPNFYHFNSSNMHKYYLILFLLCIALGKII